MGLVPELYHPADKNMHDDMHNCFDDKLEFGVYDKPYEYISSRKNSDKSIRSPIDKPIQKWKSESSHDVQGSHLPELLDFSEKPVAHDLVEESKESVSKSITGNSVYKRVKIDDETEHELNNDNKSIKEVSLEKKKELNRKSASQCRKRRKEYVAQLENRVTDLESEVYKLKRKLRFYEQSEKLNAMSQKESSHEQAACKDDEYDKLDSLIQQHEETGDKNEELSKLIKTIKGRSGTAGYVRKQQIDKMIKKIAETVMPSHVKYVISSCTNENGYFEKVRGRKLAKNLHAKTQRGKYVDYAEKVQDPEAHIWKEIIYTIGLNSEEIKLLKKQRSKIMRLKERFSNHLSKFVKIKDEMSNLSLELETTLDQVGVNVKPIQIAKFLRYVDKIKHRKEIKVFEEHQESE